MNEIQPAQALTDLILETFRLNGALIAAGNQLTEPYSLTSARWQVVGAIDLAGQAITVAQIARRMGLTRQAVQRIVNDLKKLEMVQVEANIDHKRAPLISISNAGQAVMQQVGDAQFAWVSELSRGLNKQQISDALSLTRTLRDRLEKSNQKSG